MKTKEFAWTNGLFEQDTLGSATGSADEVLYTIRMADLLQMPDVNFGEVAAVDVMVRSLLN